MLVRLLLGTLAVCPGIVGAGVGWYYPGIGVAVFGALTAAVVVFLLLADVFPAPKNHEAGR